MTHETHVHLEQDGPIASLWLDGPAQRNALARSTMTRLCEELERLETCPDIAVVLLRGRGESFCAGFDLGPVVDEPALLGEFIPGLSQLLKRMRQHRAVIVAGVQGAAIAGGCAIVSACDLVVASPGAKLGYPVHALGLSPVVSAPTLAQAIGDGAARSLLLSGRLISGTEAHQLGLATHLHDDPVKASGDLASTISGHSPQALEATKAWLNELDGSLDEDRFDGPVAGSAPLATDAESMSLLRKRWMRR